jgi:hypothetical protein
MLTKKEYGLEIDNLEGTFDEIIKRLQQLKEWSQTPRDPITDKPDPDGIKYIGIGYGGPSGLGTSLYYERIESDAEYSQRMERLQKVKAKTEAKLKRLSEQIADQ